MSTPVPTTASFYRRAIDQMTLLRNEASEFQRQISTSTKFERGSQSPEAVSRMRQLERQERLVAIDKFNADGVEQSLTATSEALTDITELMTRARDLALSGTSEASKGSREILAAEIDDLRRSLIDFANLEDSKGQPLFGGKSAPPAYTENPDGTVTYSGSADNAEVQVGRGVSVERSVTGPSVFEFESEGATVDVFTFLSNVSDSLRGNNGPVSDAVKNSLKGFENMLDGFNRAQAVIGARINWVETIQESEVTRAEARAIEKNDVGGVDLAKTISQLQQTLTVLEASQLAFTRLSSLDLFDQI